jgi:hypothetical protein
MSRFTLLGGMLAMLAVAGATLTLTTKPSGVGTARAAPADPLTARLRTLSAEMALP